jgi:putative alpha-1,2-mannosidase
MDLTTHTLQPPQRAYYSDLSIWDIYRNAMPLMSLLYPDTIMADIAQSIVTMAKQGGTQEKIVKPNH